MNIRTIVFDYLQSMPTDPTIHGRGYEEKRYEQVAREIYRIKDMAGEFKCPVWVAVQAKQKLENATPPVMIPGQYDCKESSYIAERADRILALWMPIKSYETGYEFEYIGREWRVEPNMLWIKIDKQRGGLPSGNVYPSRIDFDRNVITPDPRVYSPV